MFRHLPMAALFLMPLAVVVGEVSFNGSPAAAIEPGSSCFMRTASGQIVSLGALCGSGGNLQLTPQKPAVVSLPAAQDQSIKIREGREAREDSGQYYNYEVLSDRGNSFFHLRYWVDGSTFYGAPYSFKTAQEAVDYFECSVIGKATAACPEEVTSALSNPTPRTRYTGTIYGPRQ